jgi:hypothetical protein
MSFSIAVSNSRKLASRNSASSGSGRLNSFLRQSSSNALRIKILISELTALILSAVKSAILFTFSIVSNVSAILTTAKIREKL